MKNLLFRRLLVSFGILFSVLHAEPTANREWTSAKGTKLTASAVALDGSEVVFQRIDGGSLRVALDQLIPADQALLTKHFSPGGSNKAKRAAVTGLPHPQGKVVGPVTAGNSRYFLYLPNSLVQGRPAPLLFFTGAGGGNAKQIERYIKGAEVCGWIVAASVESKNGRDGGPFIEASIKHIKETLPVDPARFYFTGGSGGGVVALINTARYDGAGAMPFIAHGVIDTMPSGKSHYYFVNGATDYNRSASASMRKGYGKNAFQRFHSGGHAGGPDSIASDGIIWLNGRFLEREEGDRQFADERLDYENAVLAWIREMRNHQPYRALMLTDILINDYEISGTNLAAAQELRAALASDPVNVAFVEALQAIDEFAQDELSKFGIGSLHKHTTKDIQSKAAKLAEKYKNAPEVPAILANLQKPTI